MANKINNNTTHPEGGLEARTCELLAEAEALTAAIATAHRDSGTSGEAMRRVGFPCLIGIGSVRRGGQKGNYGDTATKPDRIVRSEGPR